MNPAASRGEGRAGSWMGRCLSNPRSPDVCFGGVGMMVVELPPITKAAEVIGKT